MNILEKGKLFLTPQVIIYPTENKGGLFVPSHFQPITNRICELH